MTNIRAALKGTAVMGAISLALAQSAQADLIQNGQFSSLTLVDPQPGYSTTTASGGQLGYNINADNWTSSSVSDGPGYNFVFNPANVSSGVNGQYGGLSLWTKANGGTGDITAPPDGGNILASDGGFPGHLAPITQTITGLTPGQEYDVTFYYAGAQQYSFTSPTTEAWYVSLGGGKAVMTPILDNESHGFTGWHEETVALTATSKSDVLSFLAYGTPSGVPPFTLLSDVSMVAAPEPSSLAGGGLVLLAFGAGSLRMFRKSRQATA